MERFSFLNDKKDELCEYRNKYDEKYDQKYLNEFYPVINFRNIWQNS